MINRRRLLVGAGFAAATLAAPAVLRAQPKTVKMGSLRLIHSMPPHFYERFLPADLKVEIITFDSPTDGKNAVVTQSVDFGGFGIAAAILGAAAGEPVVVVGACLQQGHGRGRQGRLRHRRRSRTSRASRSASGRARRRRSSSSSACAWRA